MAATTLYIIAYDIPHDRRRTKVHKLLCGYGNWTQYSLFECWLSRKHRVELQAKLNRLINDNEDTVRIYPLCAACVKDTITIGSPKPIEQKTFII